MNSPQIDRIRKTRFYLMLVSMTVLVIAGFWFTQFRSHIADQKLRNRMLADAVDLAQALDIQMVKMLTFTPDDENSASYHRICEQMRAYGKLIYQKGIYSMKLVDGEIYFGPENYPEDDPDASPPGTLYEEPSDSDFEVLRTGNPTVFGPITDEYGSFISALAPVIDPVTGETLMVIGIDIPAEIHQKSIRNSRYLPVILSGVLFLLLITGYFVLIRRLNYEPGKKVKYRFVEPALVLLSGIIVTTAFTILSTEAEQSEKEQIFNSKSVAFTSILRNAVHTLQDDIVALNRFMAVNSEVSPEKFKLFVQPIASVSVADAFMWAPVNLPVETWDDGHFELVFHPDFSIQQHINIRPGENQSFTQAVTRSLSTGLINSCNLFDPHASGDDMTRLLVLKSVVRRDKNRNVSDNDTLCGVVAALLSWQKSLEVSLKSSGQFKEYFEASIYDLTQEPPSIIASLSKGDDNETQNQLHQYGEDGRFFARIVPLFNFGKTFAILAKSSPAFHKAYPLVNGKVSLITGLFVTLILTLFVSFQRNRQYFLEHRVNERTSELNERVKELTCLNRINDELRLKQHPDELFQNIIHHLRYGMQYPERVFPEIVIDEKQYPQLIVTHNYPVGISQDIVRFGKVAGKIDLRFSQPISILPEEKTMLDQVAQLLSRWLERKQAETTSHQRESEMKAFLNAATESIFLIDTDGCIITANQESARRFKTPIEKLTGANIFKFLPDPHAAYSKSMVDELIRTGTPVRFELEQGGRIYYINLSPVRNQEEIITNIAVFGIDITERKNIETELKKAKSKAEASDNLKTAFLNNISHEVRTPLNGILGFADIISQPGLSKTEIDQCMDILHVSSKRLIDTINDYMDMSLIVSGNLQVVRQSFFISKTMMEVYETHLPFSESKSLELHLEIPGEHTNLLINQDEELIRKVLSQLVDNAIKFSQMGHITFGFRVDDHLIVFHIKDQGIGISSDAIERIFDNFVQEDVSRTRRHEGSGLGLSIARGIVNLLGGNITVESVKDSGTSFTVMIPVDPDKPVEQKKKTEAFHKHSSGNPLLLIAEDDESNFMYLQSVLEKRKIRLLRAYNGVEAVEICKNNNDIAAVLMDLKMPLMDGFEATRQIKSFRNSLPIIAITAFALSGDERKALDAGCDDYLPKPLKIGILLKKLEKFRITISE